MNPSLDARNRKVSMWQLEMDATNASSGSRLAGFEYGVGTTAGDDEAAKVSPPSKVQVCSREYFPFKNSALVRFQLTMAMYLDMLQVFTHMSRSPISKSQKVYPAPGPVP